MSIGTIKNIKILVKIKISELLTLVNPFMYYKNRNFLLNYYRASEVNKYFKNPWRINEIALGLYYNTLIFLKF